MRPLVLIILSSSIVWSLIGQSPTMYFSHLTAEDGFPDNLVFTALMDQKGYMWFGTDDDLIRWDGNNFTTFEVNEEDTSSISSRVIKDLHEDEAGYIWVATVGGSLNRFDPETEKFRVYYPNASNPDAISGTGTVCIFEDSDNDLWIGTFNNGFNRFDRETERFKSFQLGTHFKSEQDSFNRNSVHDILEDVADRNILWLAGDNGLYRFDKRTEKLDHYPSSYPLTSGTSVQKLFMREPGKLWLGTYGMGMVYFDTINRTWDYSDQDTEGQRPLSRGIFQGIEYKSDHELWVASMDLGLGVLDTRTGLIDFIEKDFGNKYGLLAKEANAVFIDSQGRLWVFHMGQGISYTSKDPLLFQFEGLAYGDCDDSGGYYNVTDFEYDERRNQIYAVSSSCEGFAIYTDKRVLKQKLSVRGSEQALHYYKTVCQDSKDRIWVGADVVERLEKFYRPSLLRVDLENGYLEEYNPPEVQQIKLQDYSIIDIHEDKAGRLWLSADPIGLVLLEEGKTTVYNPLEGQGAEKGIKIKQIVENEEGQLWLPTMFHRLFLFDPKDGSFQHYNHKSIVETDIDGVALDKSGNLWMGHGRGIQVIPAGTGPEESLELFTPVDRRKSAIIDRILIDKDQHIWVTTKKGLSYFDPTVPNFIAFDEFDGLHKKSFFSHGIKEMPWGEILIGQNDGFYSFYPDQIFDQKEVPDLVFHDFKVFQERKEFEKNINLLDRIELSYKENFFSISFSMLSYDQPEKSTYACYLEGFDKDWYYIENQNFASYTDVGAGTYTFMVRAADRRGAWNEEVISLEIVIHPPWYQTTWAYLGYILLVGLLSLQFYRYQKRRWHLKLQLELKEQEASKFRQLDVAKTRLYTNITHEFRTPLTIILGIADKVEQQPTQWLERGIRMIKRNSRNLLFLVNQMLDLSKLESDALKVNMVQGNILPYLKYITESFHSYSETKNIRMHFLAELDELVMDYDIEKTLNILSNLLSNAIKFSKESGDVYLRVEKIADKDGQAYLQLKVKDTGIGIAASKLPYIFDRFYQADDSATRKGEGTGIGLALTRELVKLLEGEITAKSVIDKGTEFTIKLPIRNVAPKAATYLEDAVQQELDTIIMPEVTEATSYRRSDAQLTENAPLALLVEDNEDIVKYLVACLESTYQLELAYNGQEGIDKALELVPDIILSDVMMPEKNGYELCNTLKTDVRTSHIPIILLTAKADAESKLSGLQKGADAYMSKPFNEEELLVRMQNLLELRRRLQSKYSAMEGLQATVNPAVPEPEASLEDAFIGEVRQVIESHLDDYDLDVSKLCRAVGLSRTPLHNKLKALTGKSTTEYIRFVRLNKAKDLSGTNGS